MTWNYVLPKETLEGYRKAAGATQDEMAHHMHMPLRTYEDLVSGKTQVRPIHSRAAEGAMLFMARKRDDASFLPEHLRELIMEVHALLQKANTKFRADAFVGRKKMSKIVGVYDEGGKPVSVRERPLGEAIRLVAEGAAGYRTDNAHVFYDETVLSYDDCVATLEEYGQKL